MNEIVQDILVGAAGDGTGGLISGMLLAAGSRVARRFQPEPVQAQLRQALEVSLLTAFETLPDTTGKLSRYYLDCMADFLRQKVVQEELAALLAPNGAFDMASIRQEFARITQGYTPEQIHDLDFDTFMQTLLHAFYQAVKQLKDLREVIRIERLDMLVAVATENLRANRITAEKMTELISLVERLLAAVQDPGPVAQTTEKAAFDAEAALKAYLAWVEEQNNTMRVLSMTRPVPLDNIYTDVYLLHKPANWQAGERGEQEQQFLKWQNRHRGQDRIAGEKILAQTNRLFIKGQPGAGKTTFLRRLALQAARAALPPLRIPLYLELRRLNSATEDLLDLLAQPLRFHGFPQAKEQIEQWLRQGRVLLLLDGLDEVLPARRPAVNDQIEALARLSGNSQVVITCRSSAEKRRFEPFAYVEMADFTPEQVERFVRSWFAADSAVPDSFLHDLEAPAHKSIQELTRTPLLLALLCIAYAAESQFPQRRDQLYRRALEVLLAQWDTERGIQRAPVYGQLTREQKEALLAYVAFHTLAQVQYIFMPEAALSAQIEAFWQSWRQAEIERQQREYGQVYPPELPPATVDAGTVMAEIAAQHGLLVQLGEAAYSFSHPTLQEYFAARYVVDNAAQDALPQLIRHVGDDEWQEVFLLTAGMLDDASEFVGQYVAALDVMAASAPGPQFMGSSQWQYEAALAEMAAGDKTITQLLQWADEKSTCVQSGVKPPAARAFFIYLALVIALFPLDSVLNLDADLDRALGRALNLASDLASNLDRVLDPVLDLDHARGLNRARAYPSVLDLVFLALAPNLDPINPHDRALNRARNHALDFDLVLALDLAVTHDLSLLSDLPDTVAGRVAHLHRWSRRHDLPALAAMLDLLAAMLDVQAVPVEDASEKVWKTFELALAGTLLHHWGLPASFSWEFTREQMALLAKYLRATQLLVECLQVATVPNREAIENRLLRSPGAG